MLGGNATAEFLLIQNVFGLFVPLACFADVNEGDAPSHEKLREREQVSNVDWAEHRLFHEIRPPAHQNKESEVVRDEEDACWKNESAFRTQQFLILGRLRDAAPDVLSGGVHGVGKIPTEIADYRETPSVGRRERKQLNKRP